MMRLGILVICIPLGTQMIAEIVYAVMEQMLHGVAPFQLQFRGTRCDVYCDVSGVPLWSRIARRKGITE